MFTTGYLAMNKATHSAIRGVADLTGPARRLGDSFGSSAEPIVAQAGTSTARSSARSRSGAARIVQQSVFMSDVSAWPAVQSVAQSVSANRLPATTVVGVDSIGPYPGLDLEIEVIAVR